MDQLSQHWLEVTEDKAQNAPVKINGLGIWIRTRDLLNTKQICQSLDRDSRA